MTKTLNRIQGPYLNGYSCTGFVAACFYVFLVAEQVCDGFQKHTPFIIRDILKWAIYLV